MVELGPRARLVCRAAAAPAALLLCVSVLFATQTSVGHVVEMEGMGQQLEQQSLENPIAGSPVIVEAIVRRESHGARSNRWIRGGDQAYVFGEIARVGGELLDDLAALSLSKDDASAKHLV